MQMSDCTTSSRLHICKSTHLQGTMLFPFNAQMSLLLVSDRSALLCIGEGVSCLASFVRLGDPLVRHHVDSQTTRPNRQIATSLSGKVDWLST
jgi:hypothetical protein